MTPSEFARELREEVQTHPAVTHPFLRRFAAGELTRWQIWGYASQHYHLVGFFPAYLEAIADRTPDAEVRRLLREILEDEYMRPQSFERSHAALYRCFLRAVGFGEGDWDRVPLLPTTRAFVQIHLDMTLRSWLEALVAVGPGHEWAIPLMFPYLVQGIERSLPLAPAALEIFSAPHQSGCRTRQAVTGKSAPLGHDRGESGQYSTRRTALPRGPRRILERT